MELALMFVDSGKHSTRFAYLYFSTNQTWCAAEACGSYEKF